MPEFQPTRWSLIQQAAAPRNTAQRDRAWNEFDHLYRGPLLSFIRRWGSGWGWGETEAEDLLQSFLAKLAHRDWLAEADPDRGKMRTFLLGRLKAHLLDARKHDGAQKRGGGAEPVSLDDGEDYGQQLLTPEDDGDDASAEFDREWAHAILDRALTALQAGADAARNGEVCRLLRSQLTGDTPDGIREVAAKLGRTEGSVRMALHRLREDFRARMRAEAAETLLPGESVTAELQYLARVLRDEPGE